MLLISKHCCTAKSSRQLQPGSVVLCQCVVHALAGLMCVSVKHCIPAALEWGLSLDRPSWMCETVDDRGMHIPQIRHHPWLHLNCQHVCAGHD